MAYRHRELPQQAGQQRRAAVQNGFCCESSLRLAIAIEVEDSVLPAYMDGPEIEADADDCPQVNSSIETIMPKQLLLASQARWRGLKQATPAPDFRAAPWLSGCRNWLLANMPNYFHVDGGNSSGQSTDCELQAISRRLRPFILAR